jgi:hypothetical protein
MRMDENGWGERCMYVRSQARIMAFSRGCDQKPITTRILGAAPLHSIVRKFIRPNHHSHCVMMDDDLVSRTMTFIESHTVQRIWNLHSFLKCATWEIMDVARLMDSLILVGAMPFQKIFPHV